MFFRFVEQVAIVLRKSGSNVRLVVARPIGEFNPLVDYVPGDPPVVPTIELSDGQVDMVALGYAHLHPRYEDKLWPLFIAIYSESSCVFR